MIDSSSQPAPAEVRPEYFDIFAASLHIDLEFWAAGDQNSYRGEILSVSPEEMILTFRADDYASVEIDSGSPIAVSYIQEGGSFRGEARVVSVEKLADLTKVTVSRPAEVSRTQLRSAFRWETLLEDCTVYQSGSADPENWLDFPIVITNISLGGVRGRSEVELPVGPDAEEFNYAVEIGLPWGYGELTFPSNLLGADRGGTERDPVWNYRIQFVDPPQSGQDAISRYINRSQMEMQTVGTAGPSTTTEAKVKPRPVASQATAEPPAEARAPVAPGGLAAAIGDAQLPATERATRAGGAALDLAREIMLSPQPENV